MHEVVVFWEYGAGAVNTGFCEPSTNIDIVFNVSLPVGMPKLRSKGQGNNGAEDHVELLVAASGAAGIASGGVCDMDRSS